MLLLEPASRRCKISLTPLIDVVFILLLFFMLSSQFSRHQTVELAVLPNAVTLVQSQLPPPLQIQLSSNGAISVDGTPLPSVDSLLVHPAVLAAIVDSVPIHMDADDDVSLQQLISASDRLSQAGASTVNLSALR